MPNKNLMKVKANMNTVNILMIGDIIGRPGRRALFLRLHDIISKNKINLVIANGENSAGGFGITNKTAEEMFRSGVDVITSGNHYFKENELKKMDPINTNLIRPLNYPKGLPGYGYTIIEKKNIRYCVINLLGRVNLLNVRCPFREFDKIFKIIAGKADIFIVDFHAETTSEKKALGWYLDGRVHIVAGTHTHVQTADERILPGGTAYITDIGYTGPENSVIGIKKEIAIEKFLKQIPVKFKIADGNVLLNSIIVKIDTFYKKVINIQRYNDIIEI